MNGNVGRARGAARADDPHESMNTHITHTHKHKIKNTECAAQINKLAHTKHTNKKKQKKNIGARGAAPADGQQLRDEDLAPEPHQVQGLAGRPAQRGGWADDCDYFLWRGHRWVDGWEDVSIY